MTVNEIERPLREEIAEIKEMLESMKKDIAAIKDNTDVDISEEVWNRASFNNEIMPYVPTQACSLEQQMEAMSKYNEWKNRNKGFKSIMEE